MKRSGGIPAAAVIWRPSQPSLLGLARGAGHLINSGSAIRNRSKTRLWRRKSSGNFWWLMTDGNHPSPGALEFEMAWSRPPGVARRAFE
jgi:hypothetical protein